MKDNRRNRRPACRKNVTCMMCNRYPCFRGIETMKSNFAETCHKFGRKAK